MELKFSAILEVLLLLLISVSAFPSAQAKELSDLFQSPEVQAMGGAATANVEGADAIYLNPAAMAGNSAFSLQVPIAVQGSSDLITAESQTLAAYHNLDSNSLNTLVGRDIYVRSEMAPSLLVPNFGISFLVDDQFALISRNQALPQFTLGYQTTNGVQFAWGMSILPQPMRHKKKKRGQPDDTPEDDLRVGIGYTIMWRRGGYNLLSLSQLANASTTEIKSIIGSFQEASAADLGVQYIHRVNERFQLMSGIAFQQIGDLNFGPGTTTQDGDLSVGVAAKYKFDALVTGTLAYDLRDLNENVEFQRHNHVGTSLAFPLVTVFGGLSEGSLPSFGASVDVWLLKVTALSYIAEEDAFVGQDDQRRYLAQVTIKFSL
jgi:hypothetical protein